MSNKAFNQGDTVFSVHGEEALWLAKSAHGHIVQPVFEDEEGEPYYSQAVTWPEAFAKPPVAKLEARIAELSARTDELQQEVYLLDSAKRTRQQELDVIEARYKAHPQLRELDLWMSGACTHMVILDSYGFEVKELAAALAVKDGHSQSLRLLALYCDPKKEKQWSLRMSAYGDGSGSDKRVILATSQEDALARARQWVASKILECRPGSGYEHYATVIARCAMKHGFGVPDELKRKVEEDDAKHIAGRLANARRDFDRAKQALEALEAAP